MHVVEQTVGELLYRFELIRESDNRRFFQGAAVNRSPEHRVFRAEVSF